MWDRKAITNVVFEYLKEENSKLNVLENDFEKKTFGDLELDSLDKILLFFYIEKILSIKFMNLEIEKTKTIKNLIFISLQKTKKN